MADPRFPDPADERLRPAGAVESDGPGRRPDQGRLERGSLSVRSVACVQMSGRERRKEKPACRPVIGKRYLTGKSLELGYALAGRMGDLVRAKDKSRLLEAIREPRHGFFNMIVEGDVKNSVSIRWLFEMPLYENRHVLSAD